MSNEKLVRLIQGDIDSANNMQQLYNQNYGMIFNVARRYAYNNDLEDLMQEAYLGLCEAVKRYEITATGAAFMTYALFWIKQSIIRYLENNGRSIRLPAGMLSKVMQYKKLIPTCQMQLGRKPTDQELCYRMRIKLEDLQAIKEACRSEDIQSLDEYLPGTDDVLLEDSVPDPNVNIENSVIDGMIDERVQTELWQIVEDNLTPEQNAVITARFRKNMTLVDTGELMGISRGTVRNIEIKALRKLRLSRIRRKLEEKFEVNYARIYRGGFRRFKYTGSSITEDVAIRSVEMSLPRKVSGA